MMRQLALKRLQVHVAPQWGPHRKGGGWQAGGGGRGGTVVKSLYCSFFRKKQVRPGKQA